LTNIDSPICQTFQITFSLTPQTSSRKKWNLFHIRIASTDSIIIFILSCNFLGAIMKRTIPAILALIIINTIFAAQIDRVLEEKLRIALPTDMMEIAIQIDRPGLHDEIAQCKDMSGSDRRDKAVEILRNHSESAQASVLRHLYSLSAMGKAENIRASYLGGTVTFRAVPDAVREISSREDVLRVIDNSPVKVIQYNPPSQNPFTRPTEPMATTWSVIRVKADSVWRAGFHGNGVVVGILDSGIRYTHVDLAPNMWQNTAETNNGVDDDFNGYIDDIFGYDFVNGDGNPMDDHGHGTSCAGIVAGIGVAAGETTGTAPGAKLMALKVIDSGGSGMPGDVIYAIEYGIDNGAHLFSMSLGWSDPSNTLKNWFRANLEDVYSAGIVVVTSAGNDGTISRPQSISAPAECPSPAQTGASSNTAIISVGSISSLNVIMSYSSRGPTHWNTGTYTDFPWPPGLMKPELCAPGNQITTTSYLSDYNITTSFGGTSAAAPCVAGGVALALSKNPSLTPEAIDILLRNTAFDLGPAGHDTAYGAGRLNCYALVNSTPIPTFPIIRIQSHNTDDSPPVGGGNGVFDAGEDVKLVVEVKNLGATSSVTGTISALGDPYVSVIDASTSWGTVATGLSAVNSSDPLIISADDFTPPGHTASIEITIYASSETYVETLQVSVGQYPRQVANHNTSAISTTISNFGSFGFFNPSAASPTGNGFRYNSTQTLYGGGFFLRLAYDNVITWENGMSSEFIPLMEAVAGGCPAGDCYYTAYIDPNSLIKVIQQSFTFNATANQDFIIYRMFIKNYNTTTFNNVCIGFYTDFDIHVESGPTWYDRAQWVPAQNWGYMWETAGSPLFPGYVGLVGLEDFGFGSVVENAVHVYPTGMGWDDTVKSNLLMGLFSLTSGSSGDDWSLIISSGPFDLAPMESQTWAVAVVAGDNLADWQTNAGQAISQYTTLEIPEELSSRALPKRLAPVAIPNPFNSRCLIHAPGNSSVEIFDLNGRRISTLTLENGIALWEAKDLSNTELPSGIYLIRAVESGIVSKTILIR